MFFKNLTELEELYLDGVNISAPGNVWGQALSYPLPNLRVLSLSGCHLSGPIDQLLAKLLSLSVIQLDHNDLSYLDPKFLLNFSNLTSLSMSRCRLYGTFPKELFQVPTMRVIDIRDNELLQGSLPEFPQNSSLQILDVGLTNFSRRLPTSIGHLRQLSSLYLDYCHFSGTLPNSMTKLTQLVDLGLSSNNFKGPAPFASSLFALPSLEFINLSGNQLSGQVLEFPNASSSMLQIINLSGNDLIGPIPVSIFKLRRLEDLSISSNKFNGTIKLDMFQDLTNLHSLDLSYNNLSVDASSTGNDSNFSSFPKLFSLHLGSCKLRTFPALIKYQSKIFSLDLSNNQISGEIPNWIWKVGDEFLDLNLSHNHLVGIQEPYSLHTLYSVDLSFNQIHGKIPILAPNAYYIDLSSNYFTSSIPFEIGKNLSNVLYFSLSNNNLTESIPPSTCNARYLNVLDLSNNNLNGTIPRCMLQLRETIEVNLRSNNLSGPIPDAFPINCTLETLDLNGNLLTNRIPKSLANCTDLEVLNLGNNQTLDTFPLFLKNISTLRVIVLQSNNFFGHITCPESFGVWPEIQIVNVASNNFSGELPGNCLTKWHAMMVVEDDAQSPLSGPLRYIYEDSPSPEGVSYEDAVTVTNKGLEMELVKIPKGFTSIDFSSNNFHGKIPKELGQLRSLIVLNLSNNALSGQIPSSFGNLLQLESLDLSRNNLTGEIPTSLSNLYFLSVLNLSYNELVGTIPKGNQIQTFSADCFQGNEGLCDPPSTLNCTNDVADMQPKTPPEANHSNSGSKIEWDLIGVEVGFIVGFGSVIGPLVFSRRWRRCYFDGVKDIAYSILPQVLLRKWLACKLGV